jgi:hypothetical protein
MGSTLDRPAGAPIERPQAVTALMRFWLSYF